MLNRFHSRFSTTGAYAPLFAVQPRNTDDSIDSALRKALMILPPPNSVMIPKELSP
jgi:hypothetical protein